MAEPAEKTSLRQWLDRAGRPVDRYECLHIFRQIVEIVSRAHSQGVAFGNVRPSCFVLSAMNRVMFIESDSCSSSGSVSGSVDESGWPEESSNSPPSRVTFPLRQILMLEDEWYASPEGAGFDRGTPFASDIYQLGVLQFELFCMFDSMDEKVRTMSNLRHRVLPPQLLLKWPKEASFCLWLLHPQPDSRPKMSEVLESWFLKEPRNNLEEHKAAINLKEEMENQELLLEFLVCLEKNKKEVADKLHDTICFLSTDIEEALNQQAILPNKGSSYSGLNQAGHSRVEKFNQTLFCPAAEEDSSCSGSRKRFRPCLQTYSEEVQDEIVSEIPILRMRPEIQEDVRVKSSRFMLNFEKFEVAYLSTRCRSMNPVGKLIGQQYPITTGSGLITETEESTVDSITSKDGHSGIGKKGWINPFFEGLCKYLSFSKLKIRAELKQGDLLNTSNLVCSLGFDRDKDFFATAGANRKIKIFECDMILNENRDHYPVVEMKSRSKISSISWSNYIKSYIASSDFEGVIQVWDVTRSQVLVEMREHERRAWSVDFSPMDPMKLASGSDDGSVKLWNINQAIILLHLLWEVLVPSKPKQMCVLFSFRLILHIQLL